MSERMRTRLEMDIGILERKVEEVKEALRNERRAALGRAPEKAARLLSSCGSSMTSDEEVNDWRSNLVSKALDLAEPKPGIEMNAWLDGDRAYCPFCGGSAAAIMRQEDTGYAFPKGLEMHLLGFGGASSLSDLPLHPVK